MIRNSSTERLPTSMGGTRAFAGELRLSQPSWSIESKAAGFLLFAYRHILYWWSDGMHGGGNVNDRKMESVEG